RLRDDRSHLPSFPTRRSSDLDKSICPFQDGRARFDNISNCRNLPLRLSPYIRFQCRFKSSQREFIDSQHSCQLVFFHFINELLLDRKSTRLNSSHVSISYAVL